ncbi:hypothetical protein B296_00042366 [Ensete ventricosum]|uniref:Uncharacterized protein n=1 Tax=Ensete ventricosum TaxID=4639 RepID=A0A426YYI3_ENSVE|nr:hypothetical protein B296_00042366 [Ensete ventricosum]
MGGGALVDGVRRWFQRRSHRSSAAASSTLSTDDPSYDESGEVEEEDQLRIVEDLDLIGLPYIRVPKRFKMPPIGQPYKKVRFLSPSDPKAMKFITFSFGGILG